MHESIARAHAPLDAGDPGGSAVRADRLGDQPITVRPRAVRRAVGHVAGQPADPRRRTREMLTVLDRLVTRAQVAGAVRDDISAIDVVIMIKGVCEARSPVPASRRGSHRTAARPGVGGDQHQRRRPEAPRPAADRRGLRTSDDLQLAPDRRRRCVWRSPLLSGGPHGRLCCPDAVAGTCPRASKNTRARYQWLRDDHGRRSVPAAERPSRRTGAGRPNLERSTIMTVPSSPSSKIAGVVTTPPRTPARKSA